MIDIKKISNLKYSGVDMDDYPKFCDAFIESADYEYEDKKFRCITPEEAEWIFDNEYDFFYDNLCNSLRF